jgi:hypothetical protein
MGRLMFLKFRNSCSCLFEKMSSQRAYKTLAAQQCASRLFLQNMHSASHQQDANLISVVAGRTQTGHFVLHGR